LIEKLVLLDKTNNQQRAKKEEVSPIFCVQNSIFMETAVSFWKVLQVAQKTMKLVQ